MNPGEMPALLHAVLAATTYGSLLAGLVLVLQWLTQRHVPARFRFVLWLLVIIRLAPIPFPESRWSALNLGLGLNQPMAPAEDTLPDTAAERPMETLPAAPVSAAYDEPMLFGATPKHEATPAARDADRTSVPWWQIALGIYLAGAAVVALRHLLATVALRNLVRRAPDITDEHLHDSLDQARRRLGVRRHLRLRAVPGLAGPAVIGLLRPCVLLPKHMSLAAEDTGFVFLHECAHVRRHDVALNYCLAALEVVHWFNPLVWWLMPRIRADRELACDELVLSATGDARGYGETLLRLMEKLGPMRRAYATVGIVESRSLFTRRIQMIARFEPSPRWMAAASAAALAALALCTLTNAANLPSTAPASSKAANDTRDQALALLQKHDEYRARLQSYHCVEEITNDHQTKLTGPQWAGKNGNSREMFRTEYNTDGTRYGVTMSFWGNIDSHRVSVPEAQRLTQYYLWDGKEFIFNLIDTRMTQAEGLAHMASPASWEIISRNIPEPAKDPAKADKLSVRPKLEVVGSARCYVIDAETKYFEDHARPPRFYTVQETRWLDPDRGYNMVKATRVRKDGTGFSDSTSFDNIVCRQVDGLWVPMEANCRKSQNFSNGDFMRFTSRIKTTTFTLNPDHQALRSFVPHLSNGQRIALNPNVGQGYTIEQTPIWQDGRVLDNQGNVLLDCTANIDLPPAAPKPSL